MNAITLNIDAEARQAIILGLADEMQRRGLVVPVQAEPDLTGVRWSRRQVMDYLGISGTTLHRYEKTLPSFPRRVNDGGQPRWLATEIKAYALINCAATSDAER